MSMQGGPGGAVSATDAVEVPDDGAWHSVLSFEVTLDEAGSLSVTGDTSAPGGAVRTSVDGNGAPFNVSDMDWGWVFTGLAAGSHTVSLDVSCTGSDVTAGLRFLTAVAFTN